MNATWLPDGGKIVGGYPARWPRDSMIPRYEAEGEERARRGDERNAIRTVRGLLCWAHGWPA
jgi:hypothetical protein